MHSSLHMKNSLIFRSFVMIRKLKNFPCHTAETLSVLLIALLLSWRRQTRGGGKSALFMCMAVREDLLKGMNAGDKRFENPEYTAPLHPNVQIWTVTGQELGESINHQELSHGFAGHLSYLLDVVINWTQFVWQLPCTKKLLLATYSRRLLWVSGSKNAQEQTSLQHQEQL